MYALYGIIKGYRNKDVHYSIIGILELSDRNYRISFIMMYTLMLCAVCCIL